MSMVQTLALILVLIVVIVFAPLLTIWSLNTLFGLGIAYTFWTWLATVWLQMVTFGSMAATVNGKK